MMRKLNRQLQRARSRRGESGFTLIELTVALLIILIVLAALGAVLVSSLGTVSQSRQRQTATALATSTMEEMRSLDYATLRSGLYCTDVMGTLYVSGSTCGALTLTLNGLNETIMASGTSAADAPLNPHITTSSADGVTYKSYSFVTVSPVNAQIYNLTSLVTWTPPFASAAKSVLQRSVAYSPSRCLSAATHPWSGPCQASFSGQAGLTNAAIAVTNATDSTQPIPGLTATSMTLDLPSLSVNSNAEQVVKLSGSAQTSDAALLSGGVTTMNGGITASSIADNDPSSASTNLSSTGSATQSNNATNSTTGSAGTLSGTPFASDTANLGTAVTSTATCVDVNGAAMPAVGNQCSWGSNNNSTATTGAGTLAYNPVGGLGKSFSLATLSTGTSSATTALITTSNGTLCPGANGVGCQESQAKRTLGTLTLGGLPVASAGDTLPPNWSTSMITVTGLTETATAESGLRTGASDAATYSRAGTVKYWNGTATPGSIDLAGLAADSRVNLATASATYQSGGHTYSVSIAGNLTAGGYTSTGSLSAAGSCVGTPCTANTAASSALVANLTYTVVEDGTSLTTFVVNVDLGAVLAQTSYLAPFSG